MAARDYSHSPLPEIEEITKRRKELGILQADLAIVAGFATKTISAWETGLKKPHDLAFCLSILHEAMDKIVKERKQRND